MSTLPQWFNDFMQPVFDYSKSLDPFPFYHDADYTSKYGCHHNDYLRLSSDESVKKARNDAIQKTGGGAMASVVYGGDEDYHARFRSLAAKSLQTPSPECCINMTSGWTANVGLLEAIIKPDMPVYIDVNAHASLWDGARLSPGKIIPVKHNDHEKLQKFMKALGPGVIIVDSYYSTNGSVCPLEKFVEAAEAFDSIIVVDEAHAFCMTGENGGGLAVETGLADRIHFRTYSLAKALGGIGGLIATNNKDLSFYATFRNRPLIFSSSQPPATSAGNLAALEIVIREPERARRAQRNARLLRTLFNEAGVDTGPSACQIVSLNFKPESAVLQLHQEMLKREIYFAVFLSPAVPKNTGLARFSIHSQLSKDDISHIAEQTIDAMKKLGITSQF